MPEPGSTSRSEMSLARARELLWARRRHIAHRRVENQSHKQEEYERTPLDEGDLSSQEQNVSMAEALTEGEFRQLREIDAALVRIEEGTYGICENCEEPIDPARLEAIPEARLCIQCADQGVSRGQYAPR